MAVAITLFLSASPTAFGQDYIFEGPNYLLSDTSIIRAKSLDSVIIYNHRVNATFMIFSPGASPSVSTYVEYLDTLFVKDFEVIDNTVYFCGYKEVSSVKTAMAGYFNINNFPGGYYRYFLLESCTEFNKLDYYRIDDNWGMFEDHLVLTGTTTGSRSDVIVDKMLFSTFPPGPSGSNTFIYFSNNLDEHFDDVITTENYIVVSSRNKRNNNPVADFWQFVKPAPGVSSIFSSPIQHKIISNPAPATPIFLEHHKEDQYAAVYRDALYSKITMVHLNAPNTVNYCIGISDDEFHTNHPIEIKYNKKSDIFDILARAEYYRTPNAFVPSQIYHISQDVINNMVSFGNGTRYFDEFVWSIDPLKNTYYFSASGNNFKIYKYRHDFWGCSNSFSYLFEIGQPMHTNETSTVEYHMKSLSLQKKEPRRIKYDFNRNCYKFNKE